MPTSTIRVSRPGPGNRTLVFVCVCSCVCSFVCHCVCACVVLLKGHHVVKCSRLRTCAELIQVPVRHVRVRVRVRVHVRVRVRRSKCMCVCGRVRLSAGPRTNRMRVTAICYAPHGDNDRDEEEDDGADDSGDVQRVR